MSARRVRPRLRLRLPAAWIAVLSLAWPVPAAPQAAPPPPPGPGRAPVEKKGFTGSYEGSAVLTNEDEGSSCRYQGEAGTPGVRLEIGAGSSVAGSIAIDLPAPAGGGCPPLRKRYAISEFVLQGQALSFTDSGGNEWALSLRENGAALTGLLAWRQGGVEEPLAEGFSAPGGRRPMARLSGEVQLRRVVAGSASAPAPVATSAGKQAGHVLGIIGANVVGLGLLYAANELGKGSSETGAITCSPRTCITGAPNEPCFCEGNVLSGAPCGSTPAGAPIGAPCDVRNNTPCQAGLSCNSGICEDRSGRCPY